MQYVLSEHAGRRLRARGLEMSLIQKAVSEGKRENRNGLLRCMDADTGYVVVIDLAKARIVTAFVRERIRRNGR